MSDVIKLLPDSVANQIAAGEVIQRPSAVIKELVENAIDAGATDVRIYIKDAGRTLIQVIDNGKGMTPTDARMAFERHATSKITVASDLFSLHTMGFRGEALPSICAISQVELITKTASDPIGTKLLITASRVESQEPEVCGRGTSISVRNLFFNTPARRKFLRSDSVEMANIMREFERMALINNNVRLSIDTGNKKLDLMPANFRQRIGDIWKNNLNQQLLPVDIETDIIKISGFISRPEFARRRNPLQYLIVNGRCMRHPYFHKAVTGCYDKLIATDTQPCYFLKFEVDPATIDVNISPTKNEIKFENEREIWPILTASVRAALGKFSAVPSIDFTADQLHVAPLSQGEETPEPRVAVPEGYNPFKYQEETSGRRPVGSAWRPTRTDKNWESLYQGFMADNTDKIDTSSYNTPEFDIPTKETDTAELPIAHDDGIPASMCFQLGDSYIVTSTREGMVIIDQHRAHVKVLFEEIIKRPHTQPAATQRIMFPETIQLDTAQQLALEDVEEELKLLGFVLRAVGKGKWKVEGLPAGQSAGEASDIVMRILDSVSDDSVTYGLESNPSETIRRKIALVMAKSGAVTRGTKLTGKEMEQIISRLFALPDPGLTPTGKPVMRTIGYDSISSMFR